MKKRKADAIPIRILGDSVLRKKAEPVEKFDSELADFVVDLTETMYENGGIGLAAPQVGLSKRIFVVDPFWYKEGFTKDPQVFINPKIKKMAGETASEEGCLSLPGIFEKVLRAKDIEVQFHNPKGEESTIEASEILSRAIQHENDHLDGILLIDRIPGIRKIFIKKKLKDLEKTTDEKGNNIKF